MCAASSTTESFTVDAIYYQLAHASSAGTDLRTSALAKQIIFIPSYRVAFNAEGEIMRRASVDKLHGSSAVTRIKLSVTLAQAVADVMNLKESANLRAFIRPGLAFSTATRQFVQKNMKQLT